MGRSAKLLIFKEPLISSASLVSIDLLGFIVPQFWPALQNLFDF
jgi:hypothetical protein